MTQRIIRLPEVKSKTGYSRSTIYDRIRQRKFPPPIQLGGRCVGWLEHEVDEWIDERIVQSRGAKGGV